MAGFVDIYAANDLWAVPLVEDYLGQFGIEVMIRPNGMSVYPMSIGPLAGFRVSVRENDQRVATRLLAQAIRDRVIPGRLLCAEA
ncbi:MAG: hypothetical protein A2Y95_01175 [Deltaproteobacteria bacterium RBG_13_65_10]|jgi:hypothetical protein|nr:MAG: hypothetical protein A2Y95_01175 [Deltaproteobacteria bacterium RBG_13_65_10]